MFSLIFIFLLLSCFGNSKTSEFKSIDNATIPIIVGFETVEGVTFEKATKSSSGTIYLPFTLFNESKFTENIELKINNVTSKINLYDGKSSPSKSEKMYIIKEISSNEISYKIMFSKIDNARPGEYKLCIKDGVCATSFIFSSPVINKFAKPKLGLEGDPIRITCVFEAYPGVTEVTWSTIQGSNLTSANVTTIISNDHVKLIEGKESKIANATLFIEKLLKNDSGIYMCSTFSSKGKDFSIVKINVKDRWAALYPFIGIVIEVVILVAAILAYEKYQIRSQNRKNKNYGDNADEDNKENDIPLATGTGDDDNVTPGENGVPTVEVEAEKLNNADNVRQREATTKNV